MTMMMTLMMTIFNFSRLRPKLKLKRGKQPCVRGKINFVLRLYLSLQTKVEMYCLADSNKLLFKILFVVLPVRLRYHSEILTTPVEFASLGGSWTSHSLSLTESLLRCPKSWTINESQWRWMKRTNLNETLNLTTGRSNNYAMKSYESYVCRARCKSFICSPIT